jgi:hypothetical protein
MYIILKRCIEILEEYLGKMGCDGDVNNASVSALGNDNDNGGEHYDFVLLLLHAFPLVSHTCCRFSQVIE